MPEQVPRERGETVGPCEGASSASQAATARDAGDSARSAARELARREARTAAAEGCGGKTCAGSASCRYVETSLTVETALTESGIVTTATSSGRCACEGAATSAESPGACGGTVSATELGRGSTAARSRSDARARARAAARECCAGKSCDEGACTYRESSIQILGTESFTEDNVTTFITRARASGQCTCSS